jgi:LuxR family maltose regulon positive regulatory protein
LNLLKEARGGENYWYAYRRQGARTSKKYAGRSTGLTLAHLEELAQSLSPTTQDVPAGEPLEEANPPVAQVGEETYHLLLLPKLSLPRLHSDTVERSRLLARLDTIMERKLTLVSAPAGFGKTTLVRQWVATRSAAKPASVPLVGWLSLDPSDNDPTRFWRYLTTACQTFHPAIGQAALNILKSLAQPPFEPESLETMLISLLNDLARLTASGIVVLEDFHHITTPYLHQSLEFFLDHLPPLLHLVIITRSEPLLPLARWRAMNELGELHANDLRFTTNETKTFLEQSLNLTLSSQVVDHLDEKLEGWVAGLRLMALALHERMPLAEISRYLENFEIGSQRTILEYFVNEVLNAQDETLQDFLLRTSLLDRLTGPLCQAVTGNARSASLLSSIAQAHLFLEALDNAGQWFRYHALFAEAMQHEARRRFGPEVVQMVYSQASAWYEAQAMLTEAVESALRAQDESRAARLIERFIAQQSSGGMKGMEVHTLRRWISQLSEPVLNRHPVLLLHYALALLFLAMPGQPSPAVRNLIVQSLNLAEERFRATGNTARQGEVAAFRALLARQRGDIREAVACATQALGWLPPEELAWRSWSLGVLGTEAYFDGQLTTARTKLLEARALGEIEGNRVYLRANTGMLSGVYGASGELRQAEVCLRQVLDEARAENDLDDIAHAQLGLAHLAYEWNQVDEAQAGAQESFDLAQHFGDDIIAVDAALLLARIQTVRGQGEVALQHLAALVARLRPEVSPLLYRLYHQARAAQAQLHLMLGNLWSAQQWRETRPADNSLLPFLQLEQEEMLVARLLIAQGKITEAVAILEPLLLVAEKAGRKRNALEMRVLIALACAAQGESQKAVQILAAVLAFTHSQGYVRLFLDEGPAVEKLLRQTATLPVKDKELHNYIQKLLQAFGQEHHPLPPPFLPSPTPALPEPLTRQEEKVLRLLAAGLTNPEIARELVVSVNTVRTQVQIIYRKLDVNNRRAAGEAARHLQLL